MKKKLGRAYISVYFQDGLINNRKKRDLTVAFSINSLLYCKCKGLTSDEIKEMIKIDSYEDLCKAAKADDRPMGSYVKKLLKRKLKINE